MSTVVTRYFVLLRKIRENAYYWPGLETRKMSSDDKLVLSEKRIEYSIYHQDSGWSYHDRRKVGNSFIRTKVVTMLELIKGTNRFAGRLKL